MDELLKLLKKNALETPEDLAKMLKTTVADVRARMAAYEKSGIIRGYQAVIDEDALDLPSVRAVIEVRVTPERDGGFDRIARRITQFPEVESLSLMSGGYDLQIVIRGDNLRNVAGFVSEKLAQIPGVVSTATHFMLKSYKDHGVVMEGKGEDERLKVSP